jgi:hypothetical protein
MQHPTVLALLAALALLARADCCNTVHCTAPDRAGQACIVNPGWQCRFVGVFQCCGVGAWCVPLCGTEGAG